MKRLPVDGKRLWNDHQSLARITDPAAPYTRRSFSSLFLEGRQWLERRFQQAGLETRVDAGGNLIGRLEGTEPGLGTIMLALTSPKLMMGISVAIPVVLLIVVFMGRKVRNLAKSSQDRVADVGAQVNESLQALNIVQACQQFVRVVSNPQKPLRYFATFHDRSGTPALTVDDLLVRQHSLIDRIPVHDSLFFIGHAFVEQFGKEPLLPAVIIAIACGELTTPVVRETEPL